MDFYEFYFHDVMEDVRYWVENSIDFVTDIIDNHTEVDGYIDMDSIVWDIIDELLIDNDVCNNGLDNKHLPDFIDDVVYSPFFQEACGDVNLNFLCRGKENGQQYVDCICRTYTIEDNYDAIKRIVMDKFGE